MTCENRLCIYWDKGACTLEDVRLDGQGSCTDCIIVNLPEEFLKQKRSELLQELDRRWAEWERR